MKLYSKYIIGNLAGPAFFITLSLTCVVWLTQSLRFIELIVNQGLPIDDFLYLITLLLPYLMGMVLPIAILCATIYTYNRLSYESELLVLKAAGISRFGIAKPALIFGTLVMCLGFLISSYLLPYSYSKFRDMQYYFRDNYASLMLEEGIFNTPISGLAVYVKKKTDNGTLEGILVHDSRIPDKPITYMAEQASLERGQKGMVFRMQRASRQQVDRKTGAVNILYFDSYPLDVSFYTGEPQARRQKAEELYISQLLNPPADTDVKERNYLLANGYERLLWPTYNLVLPLLILGILLTGDFNRRGQSKRIIISVLLCAAIIVAGVVGKNLVRGGHQAGLYVMAAPLVLTSVYSLARLFASKRVRLIR
jgi:lipopolysaccharide export system permease protein